MAYAVPTSANFVLNHSVVGPIPGFWSAAEYAQKLVKFSQQINSFLRITGDLSDAESLQAIEVVMDALIMKDFEYDRETKGIVGWNQVTRTSPNLFDPENAPLRVMLSQIAVGTDADDVPAMTREMHQGSNNNAYRLD